MKKVLSSLQAALLLGALSVTAVSFVPAEARAGETCSSHNCDGGEYLCTFIIDPVTGEREKCTLSCT